MNTLPPRRPRKRATLKPETAAKRQQEKAIEMGMLRQVVASLERLERYCGLRASVAASPAMPPPPPPLPDKRREDLVDELARLLAEGARLLIARRERQEPGV